MQNPLSQCKKHKKMLESIGFWIRAFVLLGVRVNPGASLPCLVTVLLFGSLGQICPFRTQGYCGKDCAIAVRTLPRPGIETDIHGCL